MDMNPETLARLEAAATLENAKKWKGLTDKYIFCQELLDCFRISNHTDFLVEDLERRFADLLDDERRELHRAAYQRVTRTAVLRSLTEAGKRGYCLVRVWDGEESAWTAKQFQDHERTVTGNMPAWQDAARLNRKAVIAAATATESCNLVFLHKDDKTKRLTLAWEWDNLQVFGKTPTERFADALVDGSAPLELHPVLNEIMTAAGAH